MVENNMERVKHQEQRRNESASEIWGTGRRTHGGEQAALKLNEMQQEDDGESWDETEKEQMNRKLPKEKR